jgi:hypothetical protein
MTKYLFVYHAPVPPADATPPDPEQVDAVMAAWNAWAGKVGNRMVDFGITPDDTTPSSRAVAGYSIIEADSLDAAVDLGKVHPHLSMPGGCEIEVHEAQPIPGT